MKIGQRVYMVRNQRRTKRTTLSVIDKIKELEIYYNFIIKKKLATNKQFKQKETLYRDIYDGYKGVKCELSVQRKISNW